MFLHQCSAGCQAAMGTEENLCSEAICGFFCLSLTRGHGRWWGRKVWLLALDNVFIKLEEHRLLIQAEEHRGRDGNSLWMVPSGSLSVVADNLAEMELLCLSLSSLKLLSRCVLNYALWEYLTCKAS